MQGFSGKPDIQLVSTRPAVDLDGQQNRSL
jgi:hypothetical protein